MRPAAGDSSASLPPSPSRASGEGSDWGDAGILVPNVLARIAGRAGAVRRRACWWAAVAWIALLSPPCIGSEDILAIDTAAIVLDASTQPPPDTRAWAPVQLPDNWNLSRPGQGGQAWYRLRF